MKIFRPHIQKHDSSKVERNSSQYIPQRHKDFAKSMEAQFAEYMIKQMKKSISGEVSTGPASNYYNDLLTKEYTKQLTDNNNGMGIQELILNDIYPKKFRNKEAYAAYQAHEESKKIQPKNHIDIHGPKMPSKKISINKKSSIDIGVPEVTGE